MPARLEGSAIAGYFSSMVKRRLRLEGGDELTIAGNPCCLAGDVGTKYLYSTA